MWETHGQKEDPIVVESSASSSSSPTGGLLTLPRATLWHSLALLFALQWPPARNNRYKEEEASSLGHYVRIFSKKSEEKKIKFDTNYSRTQAHFAANTTTTNGVRLTFCTGAAARIPLQDHSRPSTTSRRSRNGSECGAMPPATEIFGKWLVFSETLKPLCAITRKRTH